MDPAKPVVLVIGTANFSNMCLYLKNHFEHLYYKKSADDLQINDIMNHDIFVFLSEFQQQNTFKWKIIEIAKKYGKTVIVVTYTDMNIDLYAEWCIYEKAKYNSGKIYNLTVNKKCIYYHPHFDVICKKINKKYVNKPSIEQYDWSKHNLDNYDSSSNMILDRDYIVRSRTLLLVNDIIYKWKNRSLYSNLSITIKNRENNDLLIDCFQYYGYKCIEKDGILTVTP